MQIRHLTATLLAVFATTILAIDEDFDFEISDDFKIEFDPIHSMQENITAYVGRLLKFTIQKEAHEGDNQTYEAKISTGKYLPSWLLFDKTNGIFWGVPQTEDIGKIHIIVKHIKKSNIIIEFTLLIGELYEFPKDVELCSTNEDTILTLIIDKNIKTIKPKQRIIAINNIAKFFGIPYSAFSLVPQHEKLDDLADSSVVLAGPGNLITYTSQFASLIKVKVGCDGRLWSNTVSLVHQLKQQGRDGTISEVLRLPLIGWRVKTETKHIIRNKRQLDDFGSGAGDYDENYYDEYDNYDDGEYTEYTDSNKNKNYATKTTTIPTPTTIKLAIKTTPVPTTTVRKIPITSQLTTLATPTTAQQQISSTHHHRHHHGQALPIDQTDDIQTSTEVTKISTEPKKNKISLEKTSSILTTMLQTTTITTTPVVVTTKQVDTASEKIETSNVNENVLIYDNEDEYDDDDDIESETIVPETIDKIDQKFEIVVETDSPFITETITTTPEYTTKAVIPTTRQEIATTKPEIIEYIPETTPTTISTLTTTITPITTTITKTPPETTTDFVILTELQTTAQETTATTTQTTTTELLTTEQETTTTIKQTTLRHITTTLKPSTTTTFDATDYEPKNNSPSIQNRLKRIATTAGKAFSYIIPENTFIDVEDGYTLALEFLDNEARPVSKTSWCQFNARSREIYGLPLEGDVSGWQYIIRATDKEGLSVSDRVEIVVQQHKSWRVVNHEFSLYIHIEKKWEFPHNIDWSLKTLRGIGQLYRLSNLTDITVRKVDYTSEPVVFVWTNDSLPKSYCPTADIERLFDALSANVEGDPSHSLTRILVPELRVKKVLYHGLGVCESKPHPPPQAPITPPTNFSPILRNPVDHINATVGKLLVFRVPDDTFYDPEDVDSRNLKMSLLTVDRQQIPTDHWLQFDSKNKEFYGIPLPQDVGRSEYQLVCEDSGGLPASDSLVVVVHAPPRLHYNVEFSMTLETSYESFVNSANMQRKFMEKLRDLFLDQNTSFIHLSSISRGSTIVSWYNQSLTLDVCPRSEIKRLETILVNNDRTIASRVQDIMDPEFPVSSIKLQLIGACKGKPIQTPPTKGIPFDGPPPVDHEDYLMTFIIPAVIIAIMLLLAGIAACVLYRKRRTGKMNIEEDGRGSYGNKGIPVIFQEELEEKPEPGTKAPIILKDEKPPLAPPEYSKSGSFKLTDDSEPYQPPPPFTTNQDNGRQSRPKPTPTYRKPPPYVPP